MRTVFAPVSNGLIVNWVRVLALRYHNALMICLVNVRDRMAEAQEGEGSTMDAVKQIFSSGTSANGETTAVATDRATISTTAASTKSVKRNSTFKIVPKRESMILPDVGHERGWIRKAGEKDDLATEGEGWKSSAYVSTLAALDVVLIHGFRFSIVPENAATHPRATTTA